MNSHKLYCFVAILRIKINILRIKIKIIYCTLTKLPPLIETISIFQKSQPYLLRRMLKKIVYRGLAYAPASPYTSDLNSQL